jgi:hypothetical protein
MEVVEGVDPAVDQFGRGRDRAVFQSLIAQRCLRRFGAPGDRRGARDTDASVGTDAFSVHDNDRSDADNGISRRLVRKFLVAPAVSFGWRRDADLGEDFVRLQGRRQEVEEEFPRRNSSLPSRSSGDDRCVEGEDRRRIVRCRIGVGERSADRTCRSPTRAAASARRGTVDRIWSSVAM